MNKCIRWQTSAAQRDVVAVVLAHLPRNWATFTPVCQEDTLLSSCLSLSGWPGWCTGSLKGHLFFFSPNLNSSLSVSYEWTPGWSPAGVSHPSRGVTHCAFWDAFVFTVDIKWWLVCQLDPVWSCLSPFWNCIRDCMMMVLMFAPSFVNSETIRLQQL